MIRTVESDLIARAPKQLWIAGSWRPAQAGARFAVVDPSTGEQLAEVADATVADGHAALGAANAAQSAWSVTPPRERSDMLRRAFELMRARIDDLALLITLENGKTLAESRAEVAYAADFLRWFSEEAVRIDGRYTLAPAGGARMLVMKQPVGPCLLITPWNFPAAMITRKVGAALAAGCTMVVKPAEDTPLTALLMVELMAEAGVPPGVVNMVPTSRPAELVAPLLKDPRLRKVSFTGSTEVGRILLRGAADNVLRSSMELGGNAPFLVFADADLDAAVEGAVVAKMRNAGEACTAANRFLVQAQVAAEFAERLAGRMGALRMGRGTDPETHLGPLINEAGRAKVEELVTDMVTRGGRVLTGGRRPDGPGYFYPATVVTDVAPGSRVLEEEVFGPVAPIASFETEEEAIERANATDYGLLAYVYTQDLTRALRISEALESGMVGLNTGLVSNPAAPFGGVKQSGLGREGGTEGIGEYLETKYVAVALPRVN